MISLPVTAYGVLLPTFIAGLPFLVPSTRKHVAFAMFTAQPVKSVLTSSIPMGMSAQNLASTMFPSRFC